MQRTVLVTGAGGFIGSAVVAALRDAGWHVRAMTRRDAPVGDGVEIVRTDLRDADGLRDAVTGVNAVVHLAALKSDERESEAVNVGGTGALIDVCHETGVRRIINISTQSAKLARRGPYGETKRKADELLMASGLDVTTLRCSLVYGDATSGVFGALVRFTKLPVVPVLGNGRPHFRPIHRDDLAQGVIGLLTNDASIGKTYDAGGRDAVTLRELTERLIAVQGLRKPIIHLPAPLLLIAAHILKVLPSPPLTVSNVLGGMEDLTMDIEPFLRDSGIAPRSFESGLREAFACDPADREAETLLRHMLPGWQPDAATIARYRAALHRHGISDAPGHPASGLKLRALDITLRRTNPGCALRRKLTVAAAIAECHPASADAFLPRNRSLPAFLWACFLVGVSAGLETIFSLPYLLIPALRAPYVRD